MEPSVPFQTVPLGETGWCDSLIRTATGTCCVTAGLYSITLNNKVAADHRTMSAYLTFAREVGKTENFHHILEVFPPNVKIPDMDQEEVASYTADSIVRIMNHLTRKQRPLLIKTQYLSALPCLQGRLHVNICPRSVELGMPNDTFLLLWFPATLIVIQK
jgi:hypothetical protein